MVAISCGRKLELHFAEKPTSEKLFRSARGIVHDVVIKCSLHSNVARTLGIHDAELKLMNL